MSLRKLGAWVFLGVLVLGFIPFVSHNVSAALPTITAYGVTPTFGDVGSTIFHFWMTYTDTDNQAPSTGYPKAAKMSTTYPNFAFVANDTGDTNYADGKLYYKDYYYFPVIGATIWSFKVKSGTDAEQIILMACSTTAILPATPEPYNVYPATNEPGQKIFTFNYTSAWENTPFHINVTVDDVSYPMVENNTGDTTYADGKDFYFITNLTAGTHNYSFQWHETSYATTARTTGEHWLVLEDPPESQISLGVVLIVGLIGFFLVILWVGRR